MIHGHIPLKHFPVFDLICWVRKRTTYAPSFYVHFSFCVMFSSTICLSV